MEGPRDLHQQPEPCFCLAHSWNKLSSTKKSGILPVPDRSKILRRTRARSSLPSSLAANIPATRFCSFEVAGLTWLDCRSAGSAHRCEQHEEVPELHAGMLHHASQARGMINKEHSKHLSCAACKDRTPLYALFYSASRPEWECQPRVCLPRWPRDASQPFGPAGRSHSSSRRIGSRGPCPVPGAAAPPCPRG